MRHYGLSKGLGHRVWGSKLTLWCMPRSAKHASVGAPGTRRAGLSNLASSTEAVLRAFPMDGAPVAVLACFAPAPAFFFVFDHAKD